MIWLLILVAVFAVFLLYGYLSHLHLVTTHYHIRSDRTDRSCTFVLLSDLHCCTHGSENEKLLRRIDRENPDYILIAGDMVTKHTRTDGEKVRRVLRLIKNLSLKYPIYYSSGNHEIRMEDTSRFYEELNQMGVCLILNRETVIPERGIQVWGLDLPTTRYRDKTDMTAEELGEWLQRDSADPESYSILIAHDPRFFKAYTGWGADLTVSGHYHGGIMRLPLVGGVISPHLGLFPRYDAGLFTENGKSMIVSRGLGSHHLKFRWFNPPELVVIHLD